MTALTNKVIGALTGHSLSRAEADVIIDYVCTRVIGSPIAVQRPQLAEDLATAR